MNDRGDRPLDRILAEADRIAAKLAETLDLDEDLEIVFDRTPLLEQDPETPQTRRDQ